MLRNKFNFLKIFIIYLINKSYSISSSSSFLVKEIVGILSRIYIIEKLARILFKKIDKFDIIRTFVDLA